MIATPVPTGSESCEGGETWMDRLYDCCCGLDVHKQTVVACLIRPTPGIGQTKTARTFGTTTDELDALADWLAEAGCTHVAMESTGVYWKPIVRHEARSDREGMEEPLQRAVAAAH
jgi:hypothetical protein